VAVGIANRAGTPVSVLRLPLPRARFRRPGDRGKPAPATLTPAAARSSRRVSPWPPADRRAGRRSCGSRSIRPAAAAGSGPCSWPACGHRHRPPPAAVAAATRAKAMR